MKQLSTLYVSVVAGAAIIGMAQFVFGRGHGGGGGGGGGYNNNYRYPTSKPYSTSRPADTTQPAEDAAIQAARADVAAAQAQVDQAAAKMWADFQASPDWTSATAALAKAQTDYDSARKAADVSVSKDPAYQSAMDEKKKNSDALQTARLSGMASPQEMADLASQEMQASQNAARIRTAALDADPSVVAAKQALAGARATLAQLKDKFNSSAPSDDWLAARKSLDDAKAKLNALTEAASKSS